MGTDLGPTTRIAMSRNSRTAGLVCAAVCSLIATASAPAADVVRPSLGPNNTSPIARAVEVPAGKTIIFHSGMTPAPADPKATPGTPEYWGDTRTQAESAFKRIKESLDQLGVGFKDVVAMTVYLGGDPAKGGRM